MALELPEGMGDFFQGFEIIGREHLSLDDREVDFDLIEPTAVNWSMDQLQAGIPLLQSLHTGDSSMGGTIINNPEHATRLAIGGLVHHLIDQVVKGDNAALRWAVAEELGVMDIQGRHIGQRPTPLVLMFHLHRLARLGSLGGMDASASLNAGLLIGRNHELVLLQGLVLPDSLVKIQQPSGFGRELRIPRKNPTAMKPRSDRVFMEPSPESAVTDFGHQPGLADLLRSGLASGRLSFSADIKKATEGAEVLWVAYDTPVDADDKADVEFVVAQIEKTLPHLREGTTILISSQMPVGSVARLETIARDRCPEKGIGFACSPENLRLGKALEVFLKPDRIVVGVRTAGDRERLERLLRPITDRIEWMSVESAEMTKHAINAFLATSVSFANEIASICELVGADAKQVERGLKTESRIGPKAYLSPGAAFAGGTLARDVAFLNEIGTAKRLVTPLLSSVKTSNDEHKQWVRRRLRLFFPDLRNACVAIWGLTYKAGTDTLRRSMAVELCNWLIQQGVAVRVHDPAVKILPAAWQGKVLRSKDMLDALKGAQALVVSTEWPQYKAVTVEEIVAVARGLTVLDANRFLSHLAGDSRVRYVGVGTPG